MDDPREVLRRHGLRPKRSWGQNFLVNLALVERIAEAVTTDGVDLVVEIGAGLGTLTGALGHRAPRVVAIERDPDMVGVLEAEIADGHLPATIEVVAADAAAFDYASLLEGASCVAIAGNLPYQITGRLIRRVVGMRGRVQRAVVMVQQEVADRLVAAPRTSSYGILGVMTQAYLEPTVLWRVSPGSFHPRPKVSSAVVTLDPTSEPKAGEVAEADLSRVVHAAFAARRKTLRNTLGVLLGKPTAVAALEAAGLDPGARAETLTVEELAELTRAVLGLDRA